MHKTIKKELKNQFLFYLSVGLTLFEIVKTAQNGANQKYQSHNATKIEKGIYKQNRQLITI